MKADPLAWFGGGIARRCPFQQGSGRWGQTDVSSRLTPESRARCTFRPPSEWVGGGEERDQQDRQLSSILLTGRGRRVVRHKITGETFQLNPSRKT